MTFSVLKLVIPDVIKDVNKDVINDVIEQPLQSANLNMNWCEVLLFSKLTIFE